MTFYGQGGGDDAAPTSKNPGACGSSYLPPDANNFVAINRPQYSSSVCGKCIEITCDDNKCKKGASTIGYVTDECAGCSSGQIDVSISIFAALAGGVAEAKNAGVSNTKWKFVTCPSSYNGGSSSSTLKQVTDTKKPVASSAPSTQKVQPKKETPVKQVEQKPKAAAVVQPVKKNTSQYVKPVITLDAYNPVSKCKSTY